MRCHRTPGATPPRTLRAASPFAALWVGALWVGALSAGALVLAGCAGGGGNSGAVDAAGAQDDAGEVAGGQGDAATAADATDTDTAGDDTAGDDTAGDDTTGNDATSAKSGKVDLLFVLDHSSSMASEQRGLAKAASGFLANLKAAGVLDVQVAVTTVQQAPDKSDIFVVGRFAHRPAQVFPPNVAERVTRPCTSDASCTQPTNASFAAKDGSSLCTAAATNYPALTTDVGWRCLGPKGTAATNGNCSLNTSCRANCSDVQGHSDCRKAFEPDVPADQQTVRCVVPGGGSDTSNAVCIFPPPTASCPQPDKIPPVLSGDALALFPCIAMVGSAQTAESTFEGGLRAAWMALDPKGPNSDAKACVAHLRSCCVDGGDWCKFDANPGKCAAATETWCKPLETAGAGQYQTFVRPGALLVLVFVSDDDDCSIAPQLNPLDATVITKEGWSSCQIAGDTAGTNAALNEASCEVARAQDANVTCPSDCQPGSTATDAAGKAKCADGCADGSAAQAACQQKHQAAAAATTKKHAAIAPVETYRSLLLGLKANPKDVMVVAIVGDSLAPSDAARHGDRVAYYRSTMQDKAPGQSPYICGSAAGEARPGTRYVELANSLGEHGHVHNLCSSADLAPAMAALATKIGALAGKP